jgi:Matrixin
MKNLISCLILLVSLQAKAFTLIRYSNGTVAYGWSNSTITFDIDPSCNAHMARVISAISTAASTWNDAPNSALKVQQGGSVALPGVITDYIGNSATSYAPPGNAIIYCDSNFGTNSGEDANRIPGFATGQLVGSDNKIKSCLMVLNIQTAATANISTMSPTVLNNILTHEIGHCIGLGHSAETEALMYYSTNAGRQTVLAKDDIDGIAYLYPKEDMNGFFKGCSAIAYSKDYTPKYSSSLVFLNLLSELAFFVLFVYLVKLLMFVAKRNR